MAQKKNYICGFVHILRGLPGSGKSTLVKEKMADDPDWKEAVVCSADDYMIDPKTGLYSFRDYMIKKVHTLCFLKFQKAVLDANSKCIVVDNTNLQHVDFVNYFVLARTINYNVMLHQLYDSGCSDEELSKRCIHQIPAKGNRGSIQQMRKKWERFSISKLNRLVASDQIPGVDYVDNLLKNAEPKTLGRVESTLVEA